MRPSTLAFIASSSYSPASDFTNFFFPSLKISKSWIWVDETFWLCNKLIALLVNALALFDDVQARPSANKRTCKDSFIGFENKKHVSVLAISFFFQFSSSVVIASSARAGSKFEARLFWLDQARKNIIMMDVFFEELIRYRFIGIGIVQTNCQKTIDNGQEKFR